MDTEIVGGVWVGGEDGDIERCILEIERTDRDEIRIGILEGEEPTHVYIAPDRALKFAHALIEEALREWRFP